MNKIELNFYCVLFVPIFDYVTITSNKQIKISYQFTSVCSDIKSK